MKRIKSLFAITVIAIISLSLSGCWNYRDVNDLNIVSGIAIDINPDNNNYLITAEIVEIATGGKESILSSSKVQAEGKTLFDAVRNMISVAGKKSFYSHMKVVIISQYVAKEGLIQVIDFISRDSEPRFELNLLVSKEETAHEILNYEGIGEQLRCLKLHEMLESQKSLSKAPIIENNKFIQAVSSDSECAILPLVGGKMINGEKVLEVSGTALFKKDKLIGFLDGDETKYLLFIKNMIKSCVLPEMGKGEDTSHTISLEVFKNKTNIMPVYLDGEISININTKTTVSIAEYGNRTNLIDGEGGDLVKTNAGKALEKNINALIRKVQIEYDADIFGFGNEIKIKMPSVWREISSDWDNLFENLTVNVKSEMDIKASGTLMKPISIGE